MHEEDYATPSGRDLMAGRLPVEIDGFKCVSDTTRDELEWLRRWARQLSELANESDPDNGSWLVVARGDSPVWGLSMVFIDPEGEVTAVVETVGGGPVGPGLLVAGPRFPTEDGEFLSRETVNAALRLMDGMSQSVGEF